MAVVRARSSPPYALIVFIFLTVIAACIAIWLAVERGALTDQVTQANNENVKTGTALSAAHDQIQSLEKVIDGSGNKPPAAVVRDAQTTMLNSGQNTTLVTRLADAVAQLKQEQASRANIEGQLAKLSDQMKQASDENKQAMDARDASFQKINTQLTSATTEEGSERQKLEQNETDAQKKLTDTINASETNIRQLKLQIQDRDQKLVAANSRIADLVQQLHRGTATSVAMAPAGIVVLARPGSGECYINLGRADRIMVGLTFSVHDPRIGIKGSVDALKPGSENENVAAAAGKGGIKVEQVGATQSLCRITKTMPGQIIQAGDLLSNPVYQSNKNRKNHFVVFGDFDLDGDGVATLAEHDRVVHLITQWGGVIDPKISPQTDFLVLGSPPTTPNANADMTPGSPAAQQTSESKEYDEIVDEAKRDGVPILNANRFLAMVGYYDTTVSP